jgi:hypothetical protein
MVRRRSSCIHKHHPQQRDSHGKGQRLAARASASLPSASLDSPQTLIKEGDNMGAAYSVTVSGSPEEKAAMAAVMVGHASVAALQMTDAAMCRSLRRPTCRRY